MEFSLNFLKKFFPRKQFLKCIILTNKNLVFLGEFYETKKTDIKGD